MIQILVGFINYPHPFVFLLSIVLVVCLVPLVVGIWINIYE